MRQETLHDPAGSKNNRSKKETIDKGTRTNRVHPRNKLDQAQKKRVKNREKSNWRFIEGHEITMRLETIRRAGIH